jgi:hypothetical protein
MSAEQDKPIRMSATEYATHAARMLKKLAQDSRKNKPAPKKPDQK